MPSTPSDFQTPLEEPHLPRADSSISSQFKALVKDLSTLFSKEISLAKVELHHAAHDVKAGVGAIAVGVSVLQAAFVILLFSACYALAEIMELWLAALIVGAIAMVVGVVLLNSARSKLKPGNLTPDRTIHSLERDANTAKGAVK